MLIAISRAPEQKRVVLYHSITAFKTNLARIIPGMI